MHVYSLMLFKEHDEVYIKLLKLNYKMSFEKYIKYFIVEIIFPRVLFFVYKKHIYQNSSMEIAHAPVLHERTNSQS